MGLESRSYFRDGSYTDNVTGWGVDFTPAVKWLIIANVVAFVLQIFFTQKTQKTEETDPYTQLTSELQQKQFELNEARQEVAKARRAVKAAKENSTKEKEILAEKEKELKDLEQEVKEATEEFQREMMERVSSIFGGERTSVVQEWGELSPNKTVKQGQVWRLLTCAFLHDRYSVWHIVFNMLMLYWFGSRLERMYGSQEFLLFYLAAALSSSVAYVSLALYTGSNTPAIGASGAVMGVMMLYVIFYPFETFMLFWILPVPLWVLLGVYVIFDLHPVLLALAGDRMFTGVAHAGHLGGLLFGLLYWKFQLRLESVFGQKWKGTRLKRRRKPEPLREPVILPMPESDGDGLSSRVDEVLKKISEQGKDSLTNEERDILIQASAKYRSKE